MNRLNVEGRRFYNECLDRRISSPAHMNSCSAARGQSSGHDELHSNTHLIFKTKQTGAGVMIELGESKYLVFVIESFRPESELVS